MSNLNDQDFFYSSLINTSVLNSQIIDFSSLTNGLVSNVNGTAAICSIGSGLLYSAGPTLTNTGVLGLTAGSGITLTGTPSNYTISASTSISSITGTANQIVVSGSPAVTLSIDPNAILTNLSVSNLLYSTQLSSSNGLVSVVSGFIQNTGLINPLWFDTGTSILSLLYTSNLKLTGASLDTIQDIGIASSPVFAAVTTSNILGLTQTLCLLATDIGGNVLNASISGNLSYNVSTRRLDTIQDITTASSPVFAGLTIGSLSGVLKATSGVISATATTSDLPEGTNLYFTNGRARAAITSSQPIYSTSGIISLGYQATNLRLNGGNLDTIQDISIASSPVFARILNSSINSSNVLVGSFAGASLTSGGGNTLVGQGAGNNITSGTFNIGLGANAFGGSGAMTYMNAGNIAIGISSLYSCTGTAAHNTAVGFLALQSMTTGVGNIAFGNSCANNLLTGNNNVYIGQAITSSTTSVSSEGAINLTGSGITGRGANTFFINATAGLYYYIPGYWWGSAQYVVGGIFRWNTFLNRGIVRNPSDSTQIICPTPGLYEFTLSGSIFSNLTSNQNVNIYVNGNLYLTTPVNYSGFVGWRAISLSVFVDVYNTTTYIQYDMSAGLETSLSFPTILTAKFVSLL